MSDNNTQSKTLPPARISQTDENWRALPQRLRGRGDWLLARGRVKDAELMFDAATEIEGLRGNDHE